VREYERFWQAGREVAAMIYTESKGSFQRLYRIADFSGRKIEVPVAEEDDYPYFVLDQAADIRKYYNENGYVVVRGLLPRGLCDRATASFEAEVKPYGGFIYRQASANPERHVFTNQGFMVNTILNVQSLDRRHFAGFRQAGLDLKPSRPSSVSPASSCRACTSTETCDLAVSGHRIRTPTISMLRKSAA
jgi:hypothetical protein